MIYNDDQCEECGAVRVSGSKLCVVCLARQVDRIRRAKEVLQSTVNNLEEKNKKLTELCERLLGHITNDVVAMGEFERALALFWRTEKKEG